eukprot:757379-Hanusia_phi.AAC.15
MRPRCDPVAPRYHDVSATLIQGIYSGGAYMLEPGVVAHAGRGKLDVCQYGSIDDVSSSLLEQRDTDSTVRRYPAGCNLEILQAQPGCHFAKQRTWRKVCVNASYASSHLGSLSDLRLHHRRSLERRTDSCWKVKSPVNSSAVTSDCLLGSSLKSAADVAKEGFQVACAVIEREKGAESQELKEFFEGGWVGPQGEKGDF